MYRPSMPYSPSSSAVHGSTRFWSSRIESTICATAAPGAYQADVPSRFTTSPPPFARALDHRLDPLGGDELRQRHAADGGRGDDGHHLVAVAAEHDGLDVLGRRAGLPGDEGAEARRVEDAGHAEHALLREARGVLRDVAHRVERVRDDDEDRVGRLGHGGAGDGADDVLVRGHEVVAAHAGRARLAGGDDEDVRPGGLLVAVRADDRRLVAEHGAGLVQVERLALRQVLDDVDEHDVGVVAARDLLGGGRADVARADDGDFLAHLACIV